MDYEGPLMERGPTEGYYCHQCTWGDRAGAKRLWDFGTLFTHATSIRPHNHSGHRLWQYLNDAPYVQRIPDQGNSGVEEPIEPLECFMILEVDGHVGFQKMSAAVMAAKPKDVRHTIFTKYQLPMLEYMPTYVQQFAHELRSMPHLRNASLRTMGPIIDSLLADAGTRGTQIERNPKERLVLDKEGNTAGTKWYNDDDSAMTSKMGMEAPKPEQTDTESEGIQGEGNFEYKINYDIISTEDTYTMPPITMASGQLPHREAVMGSTTVRFSPAGVTKVFLPPKRDS